MPAMVSNAPEPPSRWPAITARMATMPSRMPAAYGDHSSLRSCLESQFILFSCLVFVCRVFLQLVDRVEQACRCVRLLQHALQRLAAAGLQPGDVGDHLDYVRRVLAVNGPGVP